MSSITQDNPPEFGKWRNFFWPIYNYELKKIIPMFVMFLFISFVYTILRNTKDALVVTAAGAEALPFIKVAGVMPAAIFLMVGYAKLSNLISKEKLFYTIVSLFIVFFLLFGVFLYPNHEWLHFVNVPFLSEQQGLKGLVGAIQNWTFSSFYIMAELWGSMVLSLLFWGFANDIVRVNEAKRFYAIFSLGANLGLLAGGSFVNFIATAYKYFHVVNPLDNKTDHFGFTVNCLITASVLSGIAVLYLYYWIQKNVLTDIRFYDPNAKKIDKKSKSKMSLKESFAFLARSKYILCIAVLVLAYNIGINLIEVTWKAQLKLQFPEREAYLAYMGQYSYYLSLTTIFMLLFVSNNVLRRFGWGVTAIITPVVLAITGAGFFGFIIFKEEFAPFLLEFGTTPLMVAVLFGTVQNILSKASKYAMFDPTKEMAYIPLDQESKVKGKAAIDVVGARLGKASGSGIQLGLINYLGTLTAATPHIAGIFFLIIAAWMWAVRNLNKEYKKTQTLV